MSPEVQYLWIVVRSHLARARDDERGVSAVEWVIITGVLILLAVGIGAIITNKITNKANGISL
jgi:Flp pilus assembly protein TadG